MSWYRRWRQPGGLIFFTLVTYDRREMLTSDLAGPLLRSALATTRHERFFEIVAMVLLPEHLHCVWKLPAGDDDYSTRWRLIKTRFTQSILAAGLAVPAANASQRKHKEQTVWQRRFVEHLIRDEDDLKRHVDYIHFNPVKHGHVRTVADWP